MSAQNTRWPLIDELAKEIGGYIDAVDTSLTFVTSYRSIPKVNQDDLISRGNRLRATLEELKLAMGQLGRIN